MQFGLDRLTAAGVEGKLHGVPVTLSPLTLRDLGTIEQMMRKEIIGNAMAATKGVCAGDAGPIIRQAFKEASATSIASKDAREGLFTSVGMMLNVIYLSLRKTVLGLTLEKTDEMVGNDFEAMAKMVEAIFNCSFPKPDKLDENPQPGQAATT